MCAPNCLPPNVRWQPPARSLPCFLQGRGQTADYIVEQFEFALFGVNTAAEWMKKDGGLLRECDVLHRNFEMEWFKSILSFVAYNPVYTKICRTVNLEPIWFAELTNLPCMRTHLANEHTRIRAIITRWREKRKLVRVNVHQFSKFKTLHWALKILKDCAQNLHCRRNDVTKFFLDCGCPPGILGVMKHCNAFFPVYAYMRFLDPNYGQLRNILTGRNNQPKMSGYNRNGYA